MTSTFESEILTDFLLEAGELVSGLGDQLLALEANPTDPGVLNAVFRAFHTIKGGAGFLAIEPMVQLCHRGEDMLNDARAGRVRLNGDHIDALLAALDTLQRMLAELRAGAQPKPADPVLLERLLPSTTADAVAPASPALESAPAAVRPAAAVESASNDPIEREFEELLALASEQVQVTPAKTDEQVSDEEFEALLDELYGRGKPPGAPAAATPDAPVAEAMGDAEFEALLDSLHGVGIAPGTAPAAAPAPEPPSVPSLPAPTSAVAGTPENVRPTSAPAVETTIRVDTARLDRLVDLIGELVLVRNRLVAVGGAGGSDAGERAIAELRRVTDDLQLAVMRTRMLPIGKLFSRFPRIVRDLARQLGKRIDLLLEGEDTDLDRNLVDALADPMVHLVRNAVDHGIEMPDARARVGKKETGTLRLIAAQVGERIVIRVLDDGKGMDPDMLRRKAVEKGLLDPDQAARLTDAECFELIFLPGFSTRQEVSDISGRGVGMDVVKTRVSELGGTLAVTSRAGHGSEIVISLPLTLATLRVLMVRVAGRVFAIPMINVLEVFELTDAMLSRVDDCEVVIHRERPLPLCPLVSWVSDGEAASPGHVVVLHIGHRQLGLVVDAVIGRDEIVVKPLGRLLRGVTGVSGATITGDGRVALVLDVGKLPGADPRPGVTMRGAATWTS